MEQDGFTASPEWTRANNVMDFVKQMAEDLADSERPPGWPKDLGAVDLAMLHVFGKPVPEADTLCTRLAELFMQHGLGRPNSTELLAALIQGRVRLERDGIAAALKRHGAKAHQHASGTELGTAVADVVKSALVQAGDAVAEDRL